MKLEGKVFMEVRRMRAVEEVGRRERLLSDRRLADIRDEGFRGQKES